MAQGYVMATAEQMSDVCDIFQSISTYKQLLDTNMDFINGLLPCTPYHWGPIFDYSNEDVQDLLYLHQRGMLTVNGQPSSLDVRQNYSYNKPYYILQTSYLNGYMPLSHLEPFEAFMQDLLDKYDYIVYTVNDNNLTKIKDTLPHMQYVVWVGELEEMKVLWGPPHANTHAEQHVLDEFQSINNMLCKTCHVEVYSRPFDEKDLPADAETLKHFVANFDKRSVTDLLKEFYKSHPDLPSSI